MLKLVKVLDENYRHRIHAMSTRTGVFDTNEFKICAAILDNAHRIANPGAIPPQIAGNLFCTEGGSDDYRNLFWSSGEPMKWLAQFKIKKETGK